MLLVLQTMATNEDPLELLSFDAAGVVIRASQRDGGETLQKVVAFANRLKHYASLIHEEDTFATGTASALTEVGDDTTPNEDESKPAVRTTSSSCSTTAASKVMVTPPKTRASTRRAVATRRRKEDEEGEAAALPAKRSRRLEAPVVVSMTQQQRQPRLLPRGCGGHLKDSKLRRSAGHARKLLNQHLSALGLSAYFSNGVVSKHGNVVSHLTLSSDWNDLPRTTNETLEWWLGTGPSRLELASPLDLNKFQRQRAIPIFWAEPQTGGAALCHYIGHFQCVRFEKVREVVVMKGERRQALLEFKFVMFDERLSTTISLIGKK